jgi:hypothetical protein
MFTQAHRQCLPRAVSLSELTSDLKKASKLKEKPDFQALTFMVSFPMEIEVKPK